MKEDTYSIEVNGTGVMHVVNRKYPFDCYVVDRSNLIALPDLGNKCNGVYFLACPKESRLGKSFLYIGQTTDGAKRLKQHARTKDKWTRAYLFVADKSRFDSEIIKELESSLIDQYSNSDHYSLDNHQGSSFSIGNDANVLSSQIIGVMDLFDYGLYPDPDEFDEENGAIYEGKRSSATEDLLIPLLFEKLSDQLKKIGLLPEQQKLYTSWRNKSGWQVCAVWLRANYIDIELKAKKESLLQFGDFVLDVSSRARGRDSLVRIKEQISFEKSIEVINAVSKIVEEKRD